VALGARAVAVSGDSSWLTAADPRLEESAQIFLILDVRLAVHEHQERDPYGDREDVRAEDRQALV